MSKRVKIIISVLVIAVIIIAVIGIVAVETGKKSDMEKESVTTTQSISIDDEQSQTKDTDVNSDENQTNFLDDVEVYEETQAGEAKTDKNGETITESYPGEDEGWSPLVSPEDLEKDK